ncbi:tRNA (cytosine-5-)-methyltransferase ncl1 [Yamadazyma tenuis]|uniref:S-adenosyl-L-methionine-dependent methyltransferase n=1 Tax=Candida tenuis (strain ATCC 10573 / BCRC 21748 / CBS 615 / JCM 9827 / NBRC 10315 / NRRL Y-1498 / VKM Y-70) TaxID=590646 RepID=G3BFE7_CANTC|nr:S-adenosyl-L-methionine-dependent methyltransferase [Yamadazyma tenuis ATCC 10573]EGV60670.1 S-adenosyl-L-methionine-dependent methyltransferase [Yamadazyma tenuis ATCC 10573]WEJ94079.1 tRNA (cytosine-5-)-methyltransferase ncl1 [Yamadazyma tenuis]
MGKKNFRKNKGGQKKFGGRSGSNKRSESWTEVERENAKWEAYYKAMKIVPEDEWDTFKKHCQENLPLTFRVTGSRAHANEINQNFIENHVSKLQDTEFEGVKLAPRNLSYYPNKLGWQLDVPKTVIRKNEQFAATQRFLVLETEVGNISRQEAVSMIPPLLMDIKPHHAVLDMCAAPGSKTAQLVEALHANDETELPTGFVLANDSDYKRSHMLVHQVKRLNSANFVVVNHDAQLFPRIKLNNSNEFLKFDRILCDVPCSGDGTMRKNVNVWKDFTVGNGLGLHSLQVNILSRGLQLLKKGGRLVYSTCSLSPVENEAVVASALRKWGTQIKVVNCQDELPGLVRRQGLSNWQVFGKDMELKEKGAEGIPETAFAPTEEEAQQFGLENCIRVYPHLQNTGGFFIAVFEKVNPDGASEEGPVAKKQKVEDGANGDSAPQKKEKLPRNANEEPFIFLDPKHPELEKCWPFYGFKEEFPKDCTLVRNATGEPLRTIYYVSPIVKEILTIEDQKLKLIHGGIKLFVAQRNDTGNCAWRVQNESLVTLRSYLTDTRQVSGNLKLLEFLFQEAFPKISVIRDTNIDKEFSDKLDQFGEGCVFLTVKRDGPNEEDLFLPLWKGKANVNLMVNKKDTQELLMRLFNIATTAKDEGKEAIYQRKAEEDKLARREAEAASVTASEEPEEASEAK